MKVLTSVLTFVALPLLVVAHGGDYLDARRHYARQASSSTSSHSGPTSTSLSTSGTAPSTTVSGSVTTSTSTSSTSNFTISLLSTNPTAVPLASIVSNEPSGPTQALTTTEVAGAVPSYMPSAPSLPNIVNFNPALYPALDIVPPTNSPEVLQWIQDVKNTGIVIPGFAPNNPGGCPNNTNVVKANNTCWWTCSGCVQPFDVTECPDPLTWGLTYDDGPGFYTTELLNYLDANNLETTFFTVGSRCAEFPKTLQVEYMSGHQIAVHTWSHPYLTTLTNEQIIAELGWTKKVIFDLLGVTPNFMRPPYGDIDDRVRAISVAMDLTPVIWTRLSATVTFDTGDFYIASGGTTAPQVIQNWENIMGNVSTMGNGFIVLEHDLWQQTVQLATGYILPDALAHVPKLTILPVVKCLNMPISNAYVETNNNSTNPPVLSGTDVTIVPPSATGGAGSSGSSSSADARFSVGFIPMFIMTIVTLLASVLRF